MSNINLIIGISGLIGFILLVQIMLWRIRVKDRNTLQKDWNLFLEASDQNHIDKIHLYGDKLIWNKHLKQFQLTKIKQIVESNIDEHPSLEKLKLNALNKQLHYDRIMPTVGIGVF